MGRPPGIPLSPEHKAKLMASSRAARSGKPLSDTWKKAISEGTKRGMQKLSREDKIKMTSSLRKVICTICQSKFETYSRARKYCVDCIPNKSWAARFKNYGITKKDWDRMLFEQGGHCALCEKQPFAVDHDHETGVVRGLLCQGCNVGLGKVDVPGWLEKASEYVKRGKN